MSRSLRLIPVVLAALAVTIVASACGQQKMLVKASNAANYQAAQIFHERCAGCHTLSSAAAFGSGNNPRTYLPISGPNFNVRCERPVTRVLYAIENGGFGGAYMPANIVVGKQAREVAQYVSEVAGAQAPVQPDTTPCAKQKVGTLPPTMTGGQTDTTQANVTTTSTNPSPGSGNASSKVGPTPNNP